MVEPGDQQRPRQDDPWGTFRAEMNASARDELRQLPRAILDGLAEAAIVLAWFAVCIVIGGLVGRAMAGESGILLGGLAGLLVAGLGIVVFYAVVFFSGGMIGVRGLLRRRRERRSARP